MCEPHYGSRPTEIVTYGCHISLKHNMTGRFLTSQEGRRYVGGSEQQAAFAGSWEADDDSTWIVMPGHDGEGERGNDVNFGDVVRLKHFTTRANLHSHPDIASPVTEQQEVTCFGNDHESDRNDEWVVERWTLDEEQSDDYDEDDPTWYVGRSFLLRHRDTGLVLHSHEEPWFDDVNEVTCFDGLDENDRWRVEF
ncbi:hypothetical protein K501DRAFT_336375 [Backusella circina FSU 941]|nr:hypothetical protein K501DRAFT_336375 [Backusella circina FSU 941]